MLTIGAKIDRLSEAGSADYRIITGHEPPQTVDAWVDHCMGSVYVCVRLDDGRVIHVRI